MKKVQKPLTPALRRRLRDAVTAEIRRYERCRDQIDRVDQQVLEAGMPLFTSAAGLALGLCDPAISLGGRVPLEVMRTAKGRRQVAAELLRITHGVP